MRWDTIQLQRGDMLLTVAINGHHGIPALRGDRDGLQGALVNLWILMPAMRPSTATTNPTPPTWTPLPPLRPRPLLGNCPPKAALACTRCCGWGRGLLRG